MISIPVQFDYKLYGQRKIAYRPTNLVNFRHIWIKEAGCYEYDNIRSYDHCVFQPGNDDKV